MGGGIKEVITDVGGGADHEPEVEDVDEQSDDTEEDDGIDWSINFGV
eukprot:SAG22_NODE_10813_length_514_cov_118.074699_2_plen_46_part_01